MSTNANCKSDQLTMTVDIAAANGQEQHNAFGERPAPRSKLAPRSKDDTPISD